MIIYHCASGKIVLIQYTQFLLIEQEAASMIEQEAEQEAQAASVLPIL
jgi:hypothetical protein